MIDQVYRDPTEKEVDVWRVLWQGRPCSPRFNSRGAADGYLNMLKRGERKPEYDRLYVSRRWKRERAKEKAK